MASTKFGIDQISSPAPLWWRRFERAYMITLVPGVSGLISGWGFSDHVTSRALLVVAFSVAMVKAIGMFLGNGQEYTDKSTDQNQ